VILWRSLKGIDLKEGKNRLTYIYIYILFAICFDESDDVVCCIALHGHLLNKMLSSVNSSAVKNRAFSQIISTWNKFVFQFSLREAMQCNASNAMQCNAMQIIFLCGVRSRKSKQKLILPTVQVQVQVQQVQVQVLYKHWLYKYCTSTVQVLVQ
jgi:hypothetical protein